MRTTRFLTPLIAALALAGCAATPPGDTTNPTGTSIASTPAPQGLTEKDSPLVNYLSAIFTGGNSPAASPEEQQAFRDERTKQREAVIATCMKDQGFDYIPAVPSQTESPVSKWHPDDRDWVAKYGYGVIQNPYEEDSQPEATEPVDPNHAYVTSLTEAEQQAYFVAYGGDGLGSEGEESTEWRWQDAGCEGLAYHEIDGKDPWQQEENKPIMETLGKFYTEVQSGPEIAGLDAAWAACMTEAGHPGFTMQRDAESSVYRLREQYWEDLSAEQDDSEYDPIHGTMNDPTYAALADQELPLALADLECRKKTDYRQALLRIRFAAEEQFIADHREELDAMKARAEQAQK